ncbi:MAG: peptidylprolyl isomerase, partial [Flavobacteriales bacterium]
PYLIDSIQNKSLIAQAYERTKTERRASHILITLKKDASPEDTLSAYNRLIEMKNRIEGGEDFAMVASGSRGSDDPSAASNGGDLGFFNAFQMLYPFEEAAYTTAVGEISDPVRTKYGYHIVKVTDKRLARGTIETAHIMVATGSKATEQKIIDAETKISEIYALLEKGENFEEMVIKFSYDPSSNKKDGKLPTFGTGTTTRMVPAFEDAAFSLKNDGDYSKPIRTDYGYHIVKRISWENVLPFNEMEKELESKVTKDVRSKTTQNSFVEKLKKEYNFKLKKSGLAWFKDNLDSTFFKGKFDFSQHKLDQEVFSMDGKKFTQKEFADHLIFQYRAYARKSLSEAIDLSYQDWVKKAILEYEESKLPSKFPAYKALITEYHDGILLYEIMSDIVWNKAMRDTSGLENYFESNKKKYTWGKRVDADIYECYAESDAKKAYEMLKNDTITSELVVEEINGKSELKIRHRKGKFEIDKTSYLKNVNLEDGLNSPFKVDNK